MRIGIDARFAENMGDGHSTYLRNLLMALSRIDDINEYLLYATSAAHPLYMRLACRSNFTVRELGTGLSFAGTFLRLGKAMYRDALDVIHVQYLLPFVRRETIISTLHQTSFLHYPGFYSKDFVRRTKRLMRRTARRSHRIITGSFHSKKDIVRAFEVPYQNVETVPYGVSAAFRPDHDPAAIDRVMGKYGVSGPFFLCVGRLNPRKNFFTVLRAYEILQRCGKLPHKLVISGPIDPEIPRMANALTTSRNPGLIYTGFVAEEDMPLLMAGASVFVYPAFIEGLGLPVLEAMASGVPVVASNASNLAEIVEGAAATVPPLDVEQTAEAMRLAATDEGFRRMLKRCGLERAARLTWDKAARRTLEIYQIF